MKPALALIALLGSCASGTDLADPAREWHLDTLNGAPFAARATLVLDQDRLAGAAPCNRYFGSWTGPYPGFRASGIGATRMACPDLPEEAEFLKILGEVTQASLEGDRLVLTGPAEQELVFTQAPPAS